MKIIPHKFFPRFYIEKLFRKFYHRAIFTVFILSFWQQLFIYLLNFFNSTVGLICVNLLIDFDAFCKRAECDAPKTSISCHNIYVVIYSILFHVLLMYATSRVLWHTRNLSYVIQFTLIVLFFIKYYCTICNLQFGGLAYHRPRPTRQTSIFIKSPYTGQIRLVF